MPNGFKKISREKYIEEQNKNSKNQQRSNQQRNNHHRCNDVDINAMDELFLNPYNFVSTNDDVERKNYEEWSKNSNVTGWIEARIETVTPICIPDIRYAENLNSEVHKKYGFFSYKSDQQVRKEIHEDKKTENPVIPGSELRGLLRSNYETLTNSCLSTLDEHLALSKRSNGILQKQGLLVWENNKWSLRSARSYKLRVRVIPKMMFPEKKAVGPFKDWEGFRKELQGSKVYVRTQIIKQKKGERNIKHYFVMDIRNQEDKTYESGYLHYTPMAFNSENQRVFVEDIEDIVNDEYARDRNASEYVEAYKKTLKKYIDNSDDEAQKYYQPYYDKICDIEKGKRKDERCAFPVYFDEGRNYFSPAPMTIRVSPNTLESIAEKQGMHQSCQKKENLCESCYLFGMVQDENSIASRIRISDAVLPDGVDSTKDNVYKKNVLLRELSSPKISATEFYLEKPNENAKYWDYDTPDMSAVKIRGRKYYWHHEFIDDQDPAKMGKDELKRRTTVDLVKKGIGFKFKIFFNNVSKIDLSRLCWSLTFGYDKNYGHKLGMGKPLGLGSVCIEIEDVLERKIEIKNEEIKYEVSSILEEVKNEDVEFDKNSTYVKEFFEISKLEFKDDVSYPIGYKPGDKNANATYHWFIQNRGGGKPRTKDFDVSLPNALDKNLKLNGKIRKK